MTAEESALLAALSRALVTEALRKVDAGDPGPEVPAETLRLAYWRAARDGLSGHGVDVADGRLRPAADLVADLLAAARPALEDSGELNLVQGWLRQLLDGGDGATRQRHAAEQRGLLSDVVDHLVAQTAPRDIRE
jgi:carboxylate-amine ligase